MSRYEVNVLLYRLKKDAAFRGRFRHDARGALSEAELTEEERDAFVSWDAQRLNELGRPAAQRAGRIAAPPDLDPRPGRPLTGAAAAKRSER